MDGCLKMYMDCTGTGVCIPSECISAATLLQGRNLDLKAKVESGLPCFSFKRWNRNQGAFNTGFIQRAAAHLIAAAEGAEHGIQVVHGVPHLVVAAQIKFESRI